ncbi:MAG: hypothetical protein QMD94_01935 [Candidatus Omnitrophota bacterium]|nr:hypothetical protein [Candidatus Omnitrophota bacterium]
MFFRNVGLVLAAGLIFVFGVLSCFAQEESITITTYYPSPYGSYRQLQADQIAIGSGYRNPNYANGSLYVEGNVGIGTMNPNPAKGISGYLDVRDVFLRGANIWASEIGRNCQICYQKWADDNWDQCGPPYSRAETCAPINEWTVAHRDDTDGRHGGCYQRWMLYCP